jgi:hypothetical protein
MLKIRKDNNIIFGLTKENLDRLLDDKPIKIQLWELNRPKLTVIPDITVYIVGAQDDEQLQAMFAGKVGPKTHVKDLRTPYVAKLQALAQIKGYIEQFGEDYYEIGRHVALLLKGS